MEASKRIVFLCGINGTGKSSLAARFQSCGYEIVDVDKSNFDTSKKVEKYYQYFVTFLKSQTVEPISFEIFQERFNALYNGVCNRDASLTIWSIYEDLTGKKTEGKEREFAVDTLYKYILAPVYREDTIINISEAIEKGINSMCIDIGSRKFLFVDCAFVEFFIKKGFKVDVVYLDLDIKRNTDNLFNIRNDKYVIFDRLNLTGVISDCLEKHSEFRELAKMLISQDQAVRERAFINTTRLLEERPDLKIEVKEKIKEYLLVRKETLGLQLSELIDKGVSIRPNIHSLEITPMNSIEEIFSTIARSICMREQVKGSDTAEIFTEVNMVLPASSMSVSANTQLTSVVVSRRIVKKQEGQTPTRACQM